MIKLNATERVCLKELVDAYQRPESCVCFYDYFKRTGLNPNQVKRAVRSLWRKGLAELVPAYDDGMLMGSGFIVTAKGQAL